MNMRLLLCQLDGRTIALPAADVHSVIEIDGILPVPRAPDFIRGIAALRSRVLTVIDSIKAIGLVREGTADGQTVVLERGGHLYGLQVELARDVVDQVGDVAPVPGGAGAGWDRVSPGMVETPEGPALLIDADALIAGPAQGRN